MSEEIQKIEIAGREVEYVLKKSFRSRSLRLRLDFSRRLYISAPRLMSTRRIMEFLDSKEAWIERNLQKIDDRNREKAAHKKQFTDGEGFSILGVKYALDIRFTKKKIPKVYLECAEDGKGVLALELNEETQFLGIPKVAASAIEKFYKSYAKDHFEKRLEEINEAHYNFRYKNVRVKSQTTRYGSCSSKGNLNFNWKVIMAPPEIVDYLLIHELCHLQEMNHSKQFWDLVGEACPDYKRHRKWLKDKGHTLTI